MLRTLTGVPESALQREMSKMLPARAYTTSNGRTEIRSVYVRQRLTEVFGLPGRGWYLDNVTMNTERRKSSSGKQLFQTLSHGTFYHVWDDGSKIHNLCFPVYGGAMNVDIQYIERSAYSSLLSHAARELGFQTYVYLDVFYPKMPRVCEWLLDRGWEEAPYIVPSESNYRIIQEHRQELIKGGIDKAKLLDMLELM